jgi:Zn-dependent protease with chaperone function
MRTHMLTRLLALALLASLVLAPIAEAHNDGRGFYGATNDKVVTNAGFILIGLFPLFVFVMSMLQRSLERRKEARKAAQKALMGNGPWRGGGW